MWQAQVQVSEAKQGGVETCMFVLFWWCEWLVVVLVVKGMCVYVKHGVSASRQSSQLGVHRGKIHLVFCHKGISTGQVCHCQWHNLCIY